jgi:hypothetical protein
VDVAATQFSVAYRNQMYIADQILPIVPVAKETGKYFVYNKASWMRNEAGVRAPGTRAPRAWYSMDTPGSYNCIPYSIATTVSDEVREQADNPLQPERTAIEFATDKILLAREARVAAALFNGTTFSSYTATAAALSGGAGAAWDDYNSSDPVQDMNIVRKNIIKSIGYAPNTMVVGIDVYAALLQHPSILERVKYSQLGVVTDDLLARLFNVEKFLHGDAIYTASEEGTTASYSAVWTTDVLMAYVARAPALESPSLGYILTYKGRTVERFREDQEHTDVFSVEENTDEIICAADAGYLLTSVVS